MAIAEWVAQADSGMAAFLASVLASPEQIVAHVALLVGIALVVAGAFARTMIPLRWCAVGSDTGLLVYGALHPSATTFIVAAVLLPVNIWRAIEMTRLTHRVQGAGIAAHQAGLWLKPYMKPRRLKAGRTLFEKGERADTMYLLVQGEMLLADIGQPMPAGRIFGEIGLFSPSRIRTHTVQCTSDCTVLEIHESTVRQLYFQDPAFGFHLIELLAARLSSDVERAERLRADPASLP